MRQHELDCPGDLKGRGVAANCQMRHLRREAPGLPWVDFVILDNQHWEIMERLMFQADDHRGPLGLCVLMDAWGPKPARIV